MHKPIPPHVIRLRKLLWWLGRFPYFSNAYALACCSKPPKYVTMFAEASDCNVSFRNSIVVPAREDVIAECWRKIEQAAELNEFVGLSLSAGTARIVCGTDAFSPRIVRAVSVSEAIGKAVLVVRFVVRRWLEVHENELAAMDGALWSAARYVAEMENLHSPQLAVDVIGLAVGDGGLDTH